MLLGQVHELTGLERPLADEGLVREMTDTLRAGDAWIIRQAFDPDVLRKIRAYLADVGRSSLPNYHPIERNAPNFHRVYGDPRSYVAGRFHQYSFFPWNLDVFGMFDLFRPAYHLNNRINGWPDEKYLGFEPETGCIARLTFQAYPRGGGFISRHEDVAGPHKFTTMTCALTTKGRDYGQGGAYLGRGAGQEDFDLDAQLGIGDLVYMHSTIEHGVAPVDPDEPLDWLAFEGKWSLILAVNKLAGATEVGDSVDLEGAS